MVKDTLAKKAQKQLYKAAKEIKLDHDLLRILEETHEDSLCPEWLTIGTIKATSPIDPDADNRLPTN